MSKKRILYVEDDETLAFLTKDNLFRPAKLELAGNLNTVQDLQQDNDSWLLATDSGAYRWFPDSGAIQLLDQSLRGVKSRVVKPRAAGCAPPRAIGGWAGRGRLSTSTGRRRSIR